MDTVQVEFAPRSKWVRNRSKYETLATIREGISQHPGLAIDLSFLLLNCPVPVSYLRKRLPVWIVWRYLTLNSDSNGGSSSGYSLDKKGFNFLQYFEAKYPFITSSWYEDLTTWRTISRAACMLPDGQWLRPSKLVKVVESLKWHRRGTPRPHAGRPALSRHCLVCGCRYRLELTECPACRVKAVRAAMVTRAAISVPSVPVPSVPVPSVLANNEPAIVTQNNEIITPSTCPKCGGPLLPGIETDLLCSKCEITIFPKG